MVNVPSIGTVCFKLIVGVISKAYAARFGSSVEIVADAVVIGFPFSSNNLTERLLSSMPV